MEVLSFITKSPDFIDKFGSFLKAYNNLILGDQDIDTLYFINPKIGCNVIYFHFVPNNLEEEFSYNYTNKEQEEIIKYLGNGEIHLFDIQFRDEVFLMQLLKDFKEYLIFQTEYSSDNILISHPHKGIQKFQ